LALKRAARVGDGWISAGLSLEETEKLINQINDTEMNLGHRIIQIFFQVMGEAAYSPE
jgi:alkanesulfonate monooxygenase SsuD/methylene tetrahydromethanopterin reductase-like flavin-dependent oxidoreductase (luciferase family)